MFIHTPREGLFQHQICLTYSTHFRVIHFIKELLTIINRTEFHPMDHRFLVIKNSQHWQSMQTLVLTMFATIPWLGFRTEWNLVEKSFVLLCGNHWIKAIQGTFGCQTILIGVMVLWHLSEGSWLLQDSVFCGPFNHQIFPFLNFSITTEESDIQTCVAKWIWHSMLFMNSLCMNLIQLNFIPLLVVIRLNEYFHFLFGAIEKSWEKEEIKRMKQIHRMCFHNQDSILE